MDQFVKFFTGPYFWRTLKNTFAISFYGLVFGFPVPIVLALLLNEVRTVWFKKLVQTLSYLPHFVSSVVIAGIAVNFLSPSHGLVNNIIALFGGEKIYFLIQPEYFRTIFTSINIWAGAGFASIIYIAALSGVDSELYEAAKIDGAGKWKQLWNVTIPGILPTIVIMLILRIGQLLNVGYEMIILLYQPSTYETGDVISSYVYRQAFQGADYSLATAVDLFDSVVALVLVFAANAISKKLTDTGIW
ncbi:putative multiple-sugar transport system permease YteP [compost metagenome]